MRPGRSRARLRRAARSASLLALAGATACASALVSEPRGWLEVRSQNFVIYTDLEGEPARELAVDLEIFRAAVLHFTNVERLDSPIPIHIFAFSRQGTYGRIRPTRRAAGFVLANPRGYDIAFAGGARNGYRPTLYHEYVHFLVRNQPTLLYPAWYDEGFAEFLSTVEQDGSQLVVGSTPPHWAPWLIHAPPLPIEDLLDSSGFEQLDDSAFARFYAWSWLLVHYLSMDLEYPPGDRFIFHMERYIHELESGRSEPEAFEIAWGFDTAELERRLQGLLRDGVARGALPIERLDFEREVASTPLAVEDAATRIGELALHSGKSAVARSYFALALERDPDAYRALAGLSDTFAAEEEWDRAQALIERALALAPEDAPTRLDHGEFWLLRASQAADPKQRADWLTRARSDFEAVLERDPSQVEALTVLGASHLEPGEDPSLALAPLEQAVAILPRDGIVLSQLMRAYAALGRQEDAQHIARRLLVAAHNEEQASRLQTFLNELGEAP